MKIGVDARTFHVKGGSRTYAINLVNSLSNKNNYVLFGVKKYKNFECTGGDISSASIKRLLSDLIYFNRLIRQNKIELFHGVKGTLPYGVNCKKVITVHDVLTFIIPCHFNKTDALFWKLFLPRSIRIADKIIAVSEATKKDIIRIFKIPEEKIKVIHEGFQTKLFYPKDKRISLNRIKHYLENEKNIFIERLDKKNIIFNVNTISPRKNIDKLIRSFSEIAKEDNDAILIIAGKKGWKYEEIFNAYENSKYKERIHFLGFAKDDIIAELYNIATLFVYPSLYEGFGLPILEAQSCGCPVVASNISSIPEVLGESGALVNPESTESITYSIVNLLKSERTRDKYIKKGYENLKRFSWEKCAKETEKVYEEVFSR